MGSSPSTRNSTQHHLPRSERVAFDRRIIRLSVFIAAPGLLVSCFVLWLQPWAWQFKAGLLGGEILVCLMLAVALHEHVVRPLRTLANVVAALRQEDYSFRARSPLPDDALGQLSLEVNLLTDLLAQQRTGAVEAAALLQRVVEEVDIPIFAFDPEPRLRLVNPAGEKLLKEPSARLVGKAAAELGLEPSLSCDNQTLVTMPFDTHARWFVRRSSFRERGVPRTLVVLSEVSRALREEEQRAWQRLIRVLGHELNNSLAPIKSIAGSLNARLSTLPIDAEQRQDFERALNIIEARAASLNRFLQAYRHLAQMPPPVLQECSIATLGNHVAALETRIKITLMPGPNATLIADPDQIAQMLINLLRNATEAALDNSAGGERSAPKKPLGDESGPRVVFTWTVNDKQVIIAIEDNGPGLTNPGNLFVPFYTTKPGGSGIGLVLSRQICEAHGGSLDVANLLGKRGCTVRVALPRKQ